MTTTPENDDQPEITRWSRLRQDIAVVTWTSFLVACVATMIFFAFIDPDHLMEVLNHPWWLPSRMGGYALGFFFFWFMSACAASLTAYMLDTSHEQALSIPATSGANRAKQSEP